MKLLLPIIIFLAFSAPAFSRSIALVNAAPERIVARDTEAGSPSQIKGNFPSGILFSGEEIKVSNIYPNPVSSSHATIDYDIMIPDTHAKVVIYNLLGNLVMEVPLEKEGTNAKISIDPLESGIYFYSLHVNGKRVAAKKMAIKK